MMNDPDPDLDLDKLERLAREATPGSRIVSPRLTASENHRGYDLRREDGWAMAFLQPGDEDGASGAADAAFIAAADPQTVLALIERVRELESCTRGDRSRP